MAKVSFNKLGLKINQEIKTIEYNDQIIEAKQYLPYNEKLDLITRIINQSIDDNGFYNPMKIKLFTILEIVFVYTNLNFTEKQKEDIFKLYDLLISSGLYSALVNILNNEELDEIQSGVMKTIDNIYKYKNSAMGILDNIVNDYSALNFDATQIQSKLANAENMEFLKDILSKMA